MQNLMKLYPVQHRSQFDRRLQPTVQAETFNQKQPPVDEPVDYSITDKPPNYSMRYNLQREVQLFPVGLWWRKWRTGSISDAGSGQEPVRTPFRLC